MNPTTSLAEAPGPPPGPLFAPPALGWFLLLDGGLVLLKVLALNRTAYERVRQTVPLPEQSALRRLLAAALIVHAGEAVFAYRRARRLGLGEAAGRWAVQTAVVGFPSLRAMGRVARQQS